MGRSLAFLILLYQRTRLLILKNVSSFQNHILILIRIPVNKTSWVLKVVNHFPPPSLDIELLFESVKQVDFHLLFLQKFV